jgi:hypothetical protein
MPPVRRDDRPFKDVQAGALIEVALKDFHPTQAVLGYDEVCYKLGRFRSNKDVLGGGINKKFHYWCEASGQEKAASVSANARLDDPASFTCTVPAGRERPATIAPMKTAVVGPGGQLYLTDGHHTFTSFWHAPDGGPSTRVRVRVLGNLSHLSPGAFWKEMQDRRWAWLFDENNAPVTVADLPQELGLPNFRNDLYRGMLYFARDIGYAQLTDHAEFQEFYWAQWVRTRGNPALMPTNFDRNDVASYAALVENVSRAMTAIDDNDIVSAGKTALSLGKLAAWNAGAPRGKGEFANLSNPITAERPGKLTYAIDYRLNP